MATQKAEKVQRKLPLKAKALKSLPAFESEADERAFWENNDSAEYVDWRRTERVWMPNLKPSTTTISLRMPVGLLERIKIEANKRDIPYQSLINAWLAEDVSKD